MYFVLNGTEQQLYYFENQKVGNLVFVKIIAHSRSFLQRSKPKGLIDLSYSSLYPVHDSFFGR
jgi:Ras GTPase-activating protein 1